MTYKFSKYSAVELRDCGAAFAGHFREAEYRGMGDWTTAVFDFFRDTKGCEGCVWPRVGRKGEFLVDHCHTTYPESGADESWPSIGWWRRTICSPCEILLAVESEWGRKGSADYSHVLILDDAAKLAAIRARTKAMIFASQAIRDRDDIVCMLMQLRQAACDDAPWLWLDVPWNDAMPRNIGMGVLE